MNSEKENKGSLGKKVIVTVLIGATMSSVLLPVLSVFAAEEDGVMTTQEITVVDEKWGKPTFVVGGGLSESEVEETLKMFGVSKESVVLDTANGEELIRYLGEGSGDTSSMISSVLVKKQDADKGISIEIVKPENITLITPMQYKKAVINLGVEGVDLKITSIRPATGESALTGVYKALELNGEELSEGQMELSNAETELFADVNEQNAAEEDFNPDEVTLMISELQKEVAELKKGQEPLSDEKLKELVEKAVEEKGLEPYINAENINIIVDTLNIFQNNPELIDNQQILDSTEDLANSLGDSLSDGFNYLKDNVSSTDAISEESQNFFQKVFSAIGNFFSNLFGNGDAAEDVVEESTKESENSASSEAVIESEQDTSSDSTQPENEMSTLEEPIKEESDTDVPNSSTEESKQVESNSDSSVSSSESIMIQPIEDVQ